MVPLWHVGDRIQNRWEVHHVQPGSVGLVYIVYDHEIQLPYAVKTLQEAWMARHAAVAERFVQAAQTWMNLDAHAHIVQAHFVEMIDGQPLLFLEYVSGGDLRDWLGIPRLTHDLPQVVRLAVAGSIRRRRDVIEQRRRGGLDRRLIDVEADAIEIVPLPGCEGLLHRLATILLGLLICGLRP
jgi:hypothetical protein